MATCQGETMCPIPPNLETIMERRTHFVSAQEGKDMVASTCEFSQLEKERHVSVSSSTPSTVESTDSDYSVFDEELVEYLGRAMECVAKDGDLRCSGFVSGTDVFVGVQKVPQISVRDYLRRMLKYIDGPGMGSNSWESLSLGARSLVFALIYIDRVATKTHLCINSFRIHRLLATGILVSLKMNEDDVLDMNYFSLLAGIPLAQLNKLEKVFLSKLDFDTFVSQKEFETRVHAFKKLAHKKSSPRRKC